MDYLAQKAGKDPHPQLFKSDGEILTEIPCEAGSRGEIRTTILSNPKVDDRVDNEFVITLTPADDRAHLNEPSRIQKLRHGVAELEIDAVEKFPLRRRQGLSVPASFTSARISSTPVKFQV